jgi:negative regulator of sigma E activity
VSYYKLATTLAQQGDGAQSEQHWNLCRDTLRRMARAGLFLDPPLVQLLEQLEHR